MSGLQVALVVYPKEEYIGLESLGGVAPGVFARHTGGALAQTARRKMAVPPPRSL